MDSSSQEKSGLARLDADDSSPATNPPPMIDGEIDTEKNSAGAVIETAATESGNDSDSTGGLERWNSPKANTYRYLVVNLSLGIMGMQDASLGVSRIACGAGFYEIIR